MVLSTDFSKQASIGAVKRIPGGYPLLGSRFHVREQPRRTIYIGEYDIAAAPVTVNQYAAFLNTGANKQERWWSREGWDWVNGNRWGWGRENRWQPDGWEIIRKRPFHPIVGVSWFEAEAYCAWVANELKRQVRLPSEEEWEYAARGEDGRPYPWGEVFEASLTNTIEAENSDTVEVGSISGDTSPFGVNDMAGNVQEWTSSLYKPFPEETYADEWLQVARGGSFNDTAFAARTSYRRAYPPGYFFSFLGFRVVVMSR